MAWGKELLLSLSVFAIRQRKRLPDGSRVKRQLLGWFKLWFMLWLCYELWFMWFMLCTVDDEICKAFAI